MYELHIFNGVKFVVQKLFIKKKLIKIETRCIFLGKRDYKNLTKKK